MDTNGHKDRCLQMEGQMMQQEKKKNPTDRPGFPLPGNLYVFTLSLR